MRKRKSKRKGPRKPKARKKARTRKPKKSSPKRKKKGKVRVMATGVFDILHTGHLYFLHQARDLGDELVVVVARDVTAKKRKREPIVPEHLRLEMVRGLKPVDMAFLGGTEDYYRIVEVLKPDIIALGYDQDHNADKIKDELKRRGLKVEVMRLPVLKHDLMATRRIVDKIAKLYPLDGVEDTERGWAEDEGVEEE
jgi:FAD synthetase